jgi:tetratricopeptide (TPR) repeat protein
MKASAKVLIPAFVLGVLLVLGLAARYSLWLQTSNDALDFVALGQFENAKKKARRSLEIMSVLPDSKSYALNLRMIASIYACRRVFEQALLWDERLLEYDRKTFGEKSAEYAGDLSDVALIQKKQKNYPLAEKLYQQVVSILSRCPGKEAEAARNKALLAWVMIMENKNSEGLELIAESDDFLKKRFGNNSWERLIGLIERARLCLREEKIKDEEGAALNTKELDVFLPKNQMKNDMELAYQISTQPKELENSSAQTVVFLNLLAQMYAELGDKEKALQVFEIAEKNCRNSTFGGFYNLFMADILEPHAKLLMDMGEKEKAEALLVQAKQVKSAKNP